MSKLKKYLQNNKIEFAANCGGGITIFCPWELRNKLEKHLKKVSGINYNPLAKYPNNDYNLIMFPVYPI